MAESHIRIDEGIKRGPKQRYKHPRTMRQDESGQRESIPPDLDPNHVLELYLSRPKTSLIASELGVRRSTLTAWMREQRPEGWKQVQIIRALLKKEAGDEGLEDATDALSLARARELVKSAQWDLERLDASNYGQKQEVTHNITGLSDALAAISQARLKGDAAPQLTQSSTSIIDVTPTQPVDPKADGVA